METAEQELEALKEWWKENGRTLVAGVVIGLGGVSGWTWWQGHLRGQAEEASLLYRQLSEDAAADRHDQVRAQAEAIVESYPGTGYAVLASLHAAKSAVDQKDFEGARSRLEWVTANADDPSFRDLARLRLARILIQEGKPDQALGVIDTVELPAYGGSVNEIRGDILLSQGDRQGAREAYVQALATGALSSQARSRVQMKLDDLGESDAANLSS